MCSTCIARDRCCLGCFPKFLHSGNSPSKKKKNSLKFRLIYLLNFQSPPGDASPRGSTDEPPARKRFRKVAEYVVLYCGSQRGTLDQVSLVLFPLCFLLFATIYWISYVSESRRRMQQWPGNERDDPALYLLE